MCFPFISRDESITLSFVVDRREYSEVSKSISNRSKAFPKHVDARPKAWNTSVSKNRTPFIQDSHKLLILFFLGPGYSTNWRVTSSEGEARLSSSNAIPDAIAQQAYTITKSVQGTCGKVLLRCCQWKGERNIPRLSKIQTIRRWV